MKGSADTYPRNDGFRNLYEPLPHMRPHIRIAPFSAATLESLLAIRGETPGALEEPEAWLNKANSVRFYASGRAAISACLSQERLERADEVLIVTTTQGPYISSCVTEAIEAVCAWSRELTPRTKMALVIHEFGFPCDSSLIAECQARRIPVMEDCAYALGSRMEGASVGCFGDYAIYSLPKHFPVPFGGILASRRDIIPPRAAEALPNGDKAFLVSVLRKAMQIGSSPNESAEKKLAVVRRVPTTVRYGTVLRTPAVGGPRSFCCASRDSGRRRQAQGRHCGGRSGSDPILLHGRLLPAGPRVPDGLRQEIHRVSRGEIAGELKSTAELVGRVDGV